MYDARRGDTSKIAGQRKKTVAKMILFFFFARPRVFPPLVLLSVRFRYFNRPPPPPPLYYDDDERVEKFARLLFVLRSPLTRRPGYVLQVYRFSIIISTVMKSRGRREKRKHCVHGVLLVDNFRASRAVNDHKKNRKVYTGVFFLIGANDDKTSGDLKKI